MANINLQEIHKFLFETAIKAGNMITSAHPLRIDTKKNCSIVFPNMLSNWLQLTDWSHATASDLVTETDKAVEDMVSKSLKDKYPDYSYVLY